MKLFCVSLMLIPLLLWAVQTPPNVEIVDVAQRTDGSKMVDIVYNLTEPEGELCDVTLYVSTNDGQSYDLVPSENHLSGAVGENIASGTGLQIVWDLAAEGYQMDADDFWFKVIAEDNSSPGYPATFIYVPGGTFNWNGSDITISSFWVDKYEITQFLYQEVMKKNPAQGYGSGAQYPVYRVSWYNCVEYCNKRSLREGLQPVYIFGDEGVDPVDWPAGWDNDFNSHDFISCDWTANGYRLLSYMEWMFTAGGGNNAHGYTYSGSDILNDVAWWAGNSGNSSHIVGTRQENELGIYDMTGNVWEWVWDRWDTQWDPGDCTDPHGPAGGVHHVTCGGGYSTAVTYCPLSWYNCGNHADTVYWSTGFRVCRNAEEIED